MKQLTELKDEKLEAEREKQKLTLIAAADKVSAALESSESPRAFELDGASSSDGARPLPCR